MMDGDITKQELIRYFTSSQSHRCMNISRNLTLTADAFMLFQLFYVCTLHMVMKEIAILCFELVECEIGLRSAQRSEASSCCIVMTKVKFITSCNFTCWNRSQQRKNWITNSDSHHFVCFCITCAIPILLPRPFAVIFFFPLPESYHQQVGLT